ncbi:hypothetical protein GLOIN_2v1634089 [Rhizophagus clarus]|uniref:Uncharacterized protein n=1 Tax=Rhizophagus clarus TaxID=94130 RepID=A0A8H3KX90_9GLOM|nr:hypothetical protein GLOIN_2v1634089 [Rhizophagus clarus]
MGKRTLTGKNTKKRAASAANFFNQAGFLPFPFFGYLIIYFLTMINLGPQQSNINGAVVNTTTNQANAQSINNNNKTEGSKALFDEEYTLGNAFRCDDDIDEDNRRSTGSNDMAELIELLQSKTKRRSLSKFNKFEYEQGSRLEKAREMIGGESGIITIWVNEMKEITSNVKRKIDTRLEREEEYIKKLRLDLENYQSATVKTLDNLAKLHTQSQKLGRDLDNNLKQLLDEAELNEALGQFIKQQNHVHKKLLHTNKKDHDMTALKKQLSGC